MLDLERAARFARERIDARLSTAAQQKHGLRRSVDTIQRQTTFPIHLLEALRRSRDERQKPSEAPAALFLAFPEKLLSKWYYLAFGPQRDHQGKQAEVDDGMLATWKRWDALGGEARISNYGRTTPHAVFVAHGLSPIHDSTLLLADLGRAARAARALHAPLHAMVADVSWMSYNRSVRRFDIKPEDIEDGLLQCRDRRVKLYDALELKHKVHAITTFDRKGSISSQKIGLIAERYLELAETIWGREVVATEQPLTDTEISRISRPLPASLDENSPLRSLSKFPGALHALEQGLKLHLDIVRTMAKRFRILSLETFSYYFAQYYAQTQYRGQSMKVAPISERDFDEPFDELDSSFRTWGEGDEAAVPTAGKQPRKRARLTAVYLPQYRLGKWELLPYSPLSLDAVARGDRTLAGVEENVLLISDHTKHSLPKTVRVVTDTLAAGAPQLDRVCFDVLSFLIFFSSIHGRAMLDEVCHSLGTSFDDLLRRLDTSLVDSVAIEAEPDSDWAGLWESWLSGIDSVQPRTYTPSHITLARKTADDWSADSLEAAAELLMIANGLAWRVCK